MFELHTSKKKHIQRWTIQPFAPIRLVCTFLRSFSIFFLYLCQLFTLSVLFLILLFFYFFIFISNSNFSLQNFFFNFFCLIFFSLKKNNKSTGDIVLPIFPVFQSSLFSIANKKSLTRSKTTPSPFLLPFSPFFVFFLVLFSHPFLFLLSSFFFFGVETLSKNQI